MRYTNRRILYYGRLMGSSPFEEIVGVISLVFVDELFVVA